MESDSNDLIKFVGNNNLNYQHQSYRANPSVVFFSSVTHLINSIHMQLTVDRVCRCMHASLDAVITGSQVFRLLDRACWYTGGYRPTQTVVNPLSPEKMADIFQTTFSNKFSSMNKLYVTLTMV